MPVPVEHLSVGEGLVVRATKVVREVVERLRVAHEQIGIVVIPVFSESNGRSRERCSGLCSKLGPCSTKTTKRGDDFELRTYDPRN